MTIPKKILLVKDLTFILPDNFDGNLSDALTEYINYRNTNINSIKVTDINNMLSSTEVILSSNEDIKSCILYGIVELDNGNYRILESSSD